MATYLIHHTTHLSGEVTISAAKNAVLPILAAGLLSREPLRVQDVPEITDVKHLCDILRDCGASIAQTGREISVSAQEPQSPADDGAMRLLRASILVLGPVLARSGTARVTLPGGCAIGQRPIDLHLKGLQAMGAHVRQEGGYLQLSGPLMGARIYLDLPSVGATENILMAATLAKGETIIENAAKEPEIVDLANCLCAMGAYVRGAGTATIIVRGVESLHGAVHRPIPDRVEAGTLACAAAITEGSVLLRGAEPEHMRAVLFKLMEAGVSVRETPAGVRLTGSALFPMECRTLVYPGFPTDMQAPMMVVALRCAGTSVITETIFENRFMHAIELSRLGAHIRVKGPVALVDGGAPLSGAAVTSTDLRAGAALMLAGLLAGGETILHDPAGHIARGYSSLPQMLTQLGASVQTIQ